MIDGIKNILLAIFYWNRFIFIFNILGPLRDLKNYYDIIQCVNSIQNDTKNRELWKEYNIRTDWLKMPYTVFNLSDEFFQLSDNQQRVNLAETQLKFLFVEFQNKMFFEVLAFKMKRLKNAEGVYLNSVLVYFRPIFNFIHWSSVLGTIGILFWAFSTYPLYEWITTWLGF